MELTNFEKLTSANNAVNSNVSPQAMVNSVGENLGNDQQNQAVVGGGNAARSGQNAGKLDPSIINNILGKSHNSQDLHTIQDIPLDITVVLGETRIKIKDLLNLSQGSIIELNRKIGEYIDIQANNVTIAKGEIVLVDGRVGVSIVELVRKS